MSSHAILSCGDGIDQCEPPSCEPCVAETCSQECVDVDDEDIGYSCDLSCSEGATCDVSCRGVSCMLSCNASECTGEVYGADCRSSAVCNVALVSRGLCKESRCETECPTGSCNQVCRDSSTCAVTCGGGADVENGEVCATACDVTSSCHVACEGACMLCCNGSPDCSLDCPTGGETCDDGTLVCGRPCDIEGFPRYCPSFDTALEDF